MQALNRELLATYWQIGQYIVEFEQAGQVIAEPADLRRELEMTLRDVGGQC